MSDTCKQGTSQKCYACKRNAVSLARTQGIRVHDGVSDAELRRMLIAAGYRRDLPKSICEILVVLKRGSLQVSHA